jgi:hypothetical protein
MTIEVKLCLGQETEFRDWCVFHLHKTLGLIIKTKSKTKPNQTLPLSLTGFMTISEVESPILVLAMLFYEEIVTETLIHNLELMHLYDTNSKLSVKTA